MLNQLRPAIVMMVLLTLITGIAYPLAITGIGQAIFPKQAAGSLIEKDGKVIGSSLIGQSFAGPSYFLGRPAATMEADPNDATKTVSVPYSADASTGSNLGPTSKALMDRVKGDVDTLKAQSDQPIPVDLVTTSASGLDPDITPAGADFQVARVAKARGLSPDAVRRLIARSTEGRTFGVLGEAHVNVLKLNLALDAAQPAK